MSDALEVICRDGEEFIAVGDLRKLMEDAEMLADVKAYDAAKARLENGEDELIPLEITERSLRGDPHSKSGACTAGLRGRSWRKSRRYRAR